MKSIGQLFVGLLSAIGTSLLVLAAASLALLEGGTALSLPPTPVPTVITATAAPGVPTASPVAATATPTATQVERTPCPQPAGWTPYLVQPGDTLESIAAQINAQVQDLMKGNCLSGSSLYPNTTLFLPFSATATSTQVDVPTPLPTLEPTEEATSTRITCSPPSGWVIYIIQPGDTLFHLAQIYGMTADALRAANCLTSTTIYAGQPLRVPYLPPAHTPTSTRTPTQAPPQPPQPTATKANTPVPVVTTPPPPTHTPVTPTTPAPTHTPVTPTTPAPTQTPVTPTTAPTNTPITPSPAAAASATTGATPTIVPATTIPGTPNATATP